MIALPLFLTDVRADRIRMTRIDRLRILVTTEVQTSILTIAIPDKRFRTQGASVKGILLWRKGAREETE